MRSDIRDNAGNFTISSLSSAVLGIKAAEKVGQLGEGNSRMVEPTHREQTGDLRGNAILYRVDIDARVEQQLRSSTGIVGHKRESIVRSTRKSSGSLFGFDPP